MLVARAAPGAVADPAPPRVLTGPAPRSELISVDEPTAATITRDLAGWYPEPALHKAVPTREEGLIRWTRFYDDVEMEVRPVTSKHGHQSITRFIPELAPPARPRRDKLITAAAAVKLANRSRTHETKLFYLANIRPRQLAGTSGGNAANFIQVVESWRLVYQVTAADGGAAVDAYTGEVVRTWSYKDD